MKTSKLAATIAAMALLSTTAYAADVQPFSALQGVEAQALSSPEMGSVYGQLTVSGLQDAIDAKLLPAHPVLDARLDAALDNHPRLANAIVNALNARN